MVNYVDVDDLDLEEPELPAFEYDDAHVPDDVPDFGAPPDFMPDGFVSAEPPDWDEPPAAYVPPEWAVGLPASALDMPVEQLSWQPELDFETLAAPMPPEADREVVSREQPAAPELVAQAEVQPLEPGAPAALEVPADEVPDFWEAELKYDPAFDDVQFSEALDLQSVVPSETSLWEQYYAAVVNGQNLGGSEAELVQRAVDMNLVDARFVGYSSPEGHHVGALELAHDPGTGQEYGQMLTVATFQDANQAAALYAELQSHTSSEGLPNYAIADLASFSALALGNELDWRPATEQELALGNLDLGLPADEPPQPLMNDLILEHAGVDLSSYAPEGTFEFGQDPDGPDLLEGFDMTGADFDLDKSEPAPISLEQELAYYREAQVLPADEPPASDLDALIREWAGVNVSGYEPIPGWDQPFFSYEVGITEREGVYDLELLKQVDGGVTLGGPEDYRVLGSYGDRAEAEALAQDMVNLRADVVGLTGDEVAGWQAMTSMAYEVGLSSEAIRPGEPLFAESKDIPADPFEIRPTADLFAEYEAMQQQQVEVSEPEHEPSFAPDMDL